MRIDGSSRLQTVTTRREVRAGGNDQGFADAISSEGEAEAASSAGSPPAVATVDGLFVLQEISEELLDKKRAAARGDALLDRLEDLRVALLSGSVPRAQLEALRHMLRDRGPLVTDPQLATTMAEIELRVAVELAKLDRAL